MNPPERPSGYLEWALELKHRLREELAEHHAEKAGRDHHSRRKPIACGMTIHPAIGCSYGCLYCYVPDMGFTQPPRPYPLSPREMVAALTLNPYFIPGPRGTLVAFGSVTEPFMNPDVTQLTLGYLREIGRRLGNPQQLSTKAAPGEEVAREIAGIPSGPPSVLISVTSHKYSRVLEPGAPPVEERIRWGALLIKMGVPVTLFLRPLIPGVPLEDVEAVMEKALEAGFREIIVGSLRVTPGIIRRLAAAGIRREELERRLPRPPANKRDQVVLRMADIKQWAVQKAEAMGYRVLPASCSANVLAHGLSCWSCSMGPCGPISRLPQIDEGEVADALEVLGMRFLGMRVRGDGRVEVRARLAGRRAADVASHVLTTVFKRMIEVRF